MILSQKGSIEGSSGFSKLKSRGQTLVIAIDKTTKIPDKGRGNFIRVLRARVDEHFAGRNRRDDRRLYLKSAIVLIWFFVSFGMLLASSNSAFQLLLCLSTAFAACGVGFNIFHDSIHNSFSANPKVNLFLARSSCAMLGVSRYFWRHKHNVLHHSYTNILEWDDDLETRGALRMSPRQAWEKKFKNQHIYCWFLYALSTIEWIFIKDFVHYFTMRINQFQKYPSMSRKDEIEFWTLKAVYFSVFIVTPFLFQPFWKCVVGLVIFHLTLGLSVTLIFNLAHIMEESSYPEPRGEQPPDFESEWAVLQLATTVNFGRKNKWLTWFSGCLNYQIEHHLFPKVSHTHYPEISKILIRTAAEFHIPYHDCPTYISALKSHFRTLKALSEPARFGVHPVP